MTRCPERATARLLGLVAGLVALVRWIGQARAHGGSLGNATPGEFVVPTWLFLATGGAVVLLSFLLATVVTDRAFVSGVHSWRVPLGRTPTILTGVANTLGIGALLFVVAVGFLGPRDPIRNAGLLLVWVGWWAGLVMVAYLLGNPWPAVDPWRRLAGLGPDLDADLPMWLGSWPRVVALLAIVWVELVSPLGANPRLVAVAVLLYSTVTVTGMSVFGEAWVGRVDPIPAVFRVFGQFAPVQHTGSGLQLRIPGSALTDATGVHSPRTGEHVPVDVDAAFVVALLWGTTFDGLASTALWVDSVGTLVGMGLPPRLIYLLGLGVGYGVFYGAFLVALRLARLTGPTFLTPAVLGSRFARGLVPIAVGYHLAHYLGFILGLFPALVAAVTSPLAPPTTPPIYLLPERFGLLALGCVLVGHVVAVWIAHSIAYRSFAGHVQAVQSQYPLTLLMVGYTSVSLWVVSRPTVVAPYL